MAAKTVCRRGHDLRVKGRSSNRTCVECRQEDSRRYWKSDHGQAVRQRDTQRRRRTRWLDSSWRYNRPPEFFDQLLREQVGRCAACSDPLREPNIDHDHRCCSGSRSCGDCVRGLLCHNCNVAIGYADDSANRLRAMAAYLDRYVG